MYNMDVVHTYTHIRQDEKGEEYSTRRPVASRTFLSTSHPCQCHGSSNLYSVLHSVGSMHGHGTLPHYHTTTLPPDLWNRHALGSQPSSITITNIT